ncbi:MAG: hypothetical protein AB2L22_16495 [Syntrophales bacterium]
MNQGPDFVHLCQPGVQSCGACCGIYNYADSTRESLVRRFRRRTTLYRRLAGPDFDPEAFSRLVMEDEDPAKRYEVIYCCEFVGFLNDEETRVGCLLHPMQNAGRDLRDASFYGRELCDGHFCPSYTYLSPAEQRALVDLLDDWYLYGLCVTDIDFAKEYFRLISERVGRMPPPQAFREEPTREKALSYFELKLTWPFRSPDVNRLGKYYFDGSQYMISFIDYDALGCERSPFDRIFLSLSSEFRTLDDLRRAEAIIESHLETFARAFGGAA